MKPRLRHIANLWTFLGHPTDDAEWSLREKLEAIAASGFDGVCWAGSEEILAECQRLSLIFVGGMASGDASAFAGVLAEQKAFGAEHVNVQLADDAMLTPQALELTLRLMDEGRRLGVQPAVETHRGTCTETPEKMYALANAYEQATGELLPISFDFSHYGVVKHLRPTQFADRLLVRPDLIQRAQQFHLRPFNGHHVQVPITDAQGGLTAEVKAWLPFAKETLRCWLQGNKDKDRDIFVCPELGPVTGGYALSSFANSWEDAKILRVEIANIWNDLSGD